MLLMKNIKNKADSLIQLDVLSAYSDLFEVPNFIVLTPHDLHVIFRNKTYNRNIESLLQYLNLRSSDILNLIYGNSCLVSVRSSGSVSTPGLMKTILNVNLTNIDELYNAIDEVYKSSQSANVQNYLQSINCNDFELSIIIQTMLTFKKNDISGVMTTHDPITNELNMHVNYATGVAGDTIMSGKHNVFSHDNTSKTLPITMASNLQEICNYLLHMQGEVRKPLEIEFAICNNQVYLLQARYFKEAINTQDEDLPIDRLICQGQGTNSLSTRGIITYDINDCKDKIYVTRYTDFDDIEKLRTVRGIITSKGGSLSHAAIIARNYDIPCIVGVTNAKSILKEGDIVYLDKRGGIFK